MHKVRRPESEIRNQPDELSDLKFPFIGAQVFIEPGQTPQEIDTWFRVLKENNFTVCRIRMFESYMKKAENSWDFTLLDSEVPESLNKVAVRFRLAQKDMLMKTILSGSSIITVVINKSDKNGQVELSFDGKSPGANVVYANKQGKVTGTKMLIAPEETMVIEWK